MKKFILTSALLSVLALSSVVFADDNKTSLRQSPSPKPVVNGACMVSAVDKRDSAIISAVDAYSSAAKVALSVRRDALKAAWGKTNVRDVRLALRAAWDAYKNSAKKARSDLNGARKAAWSQFKTDSRVCKPSVNEERENEGSDVQL